MSDTNISDLDPKTPILPFQRRLEITSWIPQPFPPPPPPSLPDAPESSSNRNPPYFDERNTSFSFRVRPARVLKQAFEVLCDSEVNELGLAYIHVDHKGFEITVDANGGTTGILSLVSSRLISFQCRKPNFEALVVSLPTISRNLAAVHDNDAVSVFQVDGSNQLSFTFQSTATARPFSVNVHNVRNNIGKLRRITHYCRAIVASDKLRRMIQDWSQAAEVERRVVSVEIENSKAEFYTTDDKIWTNDFNVFRHIGAADKAPGQIYRTWFQWDFATALEKASYLKNEVRVCFSSNSKRDIVFQFNLGRLGDLLILKKTLATFPDVDFVEFLQNSRLVIRR